MCSLPLRYLFTSQTGVESAEFFFKYFGERSDCIDSFLFLDNSALKQETNAIVSFFHFLLFYYL